MPATQGGLFLGKILSHQPPRISKQPLEWPLDLYGSFFFLLKAHSGLLHCMVFLTTLQDRLLMSPLDSLWCSISEQNFDMAFL